MFDLMERKNLMGRRVKNNLLSKKEGAQQKKLSRLDKQKWIHFLKKTI